MRCWLLVLVAACGTDEPKPEDWFEATRTIELDVVMSDGGAQVYARNDLKRDCLGRSTFPSPGTCLFAADYFSCPEGPATTCIEEITLDGIASRDTLPHYRLANAFWFPQTFGSTTTLRIRGCGNEFEATIPLDSLPTPTITTTADVDGIVTATWVTDRDAPTALATMSLSLTAEVCHTIGTSQRFKYATGLIGVRAFAPVLTFVDDIGTIRVWRGRGNEVDAPVATSE